MKILYFARIRQIAGRGSDEFDVPADVTTVSALMDYLAAQDDGLAAAFSDRRIVKVAVNQAHVGLDAPLSGAREVAFFPPVTGG